MLPSFIIPHSSLCITVFAYHFTNLIAEEDPAMKSIRDMLNHSEGHARKHSTRFPDFKESRPDKRQPGEMENRTVHDSDPFPHSGFRRQSFALHNLLNNSPQGKHILDELNTKNCFHGKVTLPTMETCEGVRQFKKSADLVQFETNLAYLDIRKDRNGNPYVNTFFPKSLNE